MNSQPSTARSGPPLLNLYLHDHLTGAGTGTELLRRAARAHRGTADGPTLTALAREVAEDRSSLQAIMSDLGIRVLRHRMALGWFAEKVARLKLNGRLVSRSPLSDVLELEAMRLGVEGKACAWRTLLALSATDRRIDGGRVQELLRRAERQIRILEDLRTEHAERVFIEDMSGAEGKLSKAVP
ncbi:MULTISPECIES: hypothetical protein [Streptomyces]|uniref:Uncharacterized protein n=1 Tax=Streptomyces cadmiisoli TaxID=2184053 RepID=A0A2Z4ITN4_9ACTN|nr:MULTISPECIES: hypothetical protein [Streptomyces]AWW36100.1 hypothetical protein DN051_05150 [Streptomyces cadmiisoli]KOV74567.1 hypothetical protein ADL00_01660 [Streptomyces sp. AS58]